MDIQAVIISFIRISQPPRLTRVYGSLIYGNRFLGRKKNSHKVMQELKGQGEEEEDWGWVGGGSWGGGGKHQEVHEGECEISMLIHRCPALNITKR